MTDPDRNKTDGVIFDIKKYAIHDGPGIRTTIFFKGCPLRCSWCHNPESWTSDPELMFKQTRCIRCGRCAAQCPQKAIKFTNELPQTDLIRCTRCGKCSAVCPVQARAIAGRRATVREIMTELVKDVVFYDESGGGVTFSGGEPLMQPDFLAALLDQCRQRDIHTAVDTCCYASRSVVQQIAFRADLFLCDIKHLDPDKHMRFTGVENRQILDNIKFLAESNCPIIVRIPVVPKLNDTPEEIRAIVRFVKSLKTIQQIDLLAYNSGGVSKSQRLGRNGVILQQQPPDDTVMQEFASGIRQEGFKVNIGG